MQWRAAALSPPSLTSHVAPTIEFQVLNSEGQRAEKGQ